MRHTRAYCTRIELIGDQLRAHFDSDLIPALGQFLLARLTPTLDPYLSIPLFPSSITSTSFTVDLPHSTLISPDMQIDIMGSCGRMIEESQERTRILLIADDSPAALLPFATQAIARAGSATLLLAHPSYPLDSLDPRIEVHHGDLVSLSKEFVPYTDRIFIHISRLSIFTNHFSLFPPSSTYIFHTPPMPCGVGACQACYIKTTRGYKMSCLDGPFFNLSSIISNY